MFTIIDPYILTLSVPILNEEDKLIEIFVLTLVFRASKGFMKALNLLRHQKEA